ncbi:hypothetical protein AQUCO_01300782v1 [Aquilegia coerulea]|uniref:Uncharacterized protein n=1 Tax=Aquilegia coerulea TaxID=218851 RepID=A0A2G5E3B7_AQUCA|nr:hypothetical protein AQUCO_01300782v1 [Aquilegia coerulea]
MGSAMSLEKGLKAIESGDFEKARKQIRKIGSRAQNGIFGMMFLMGCYVKIFVDENPCFTKTSASIVTLGALSTVLLSFWAFSSMLKLAKEMARKKILLANKNNDDPGVLTVIKFSLLDYLSHDFVMLLGFAGMGLTFICILFVYVVSCCDVSVHGCCPK